MEGVRFLRLSYKFKNKLKGVEMKVETYTFSTKQRDMGNLGVGLSCDGYPLTTLYLNHFTWAWPCSFGKVLTYLATRQN